MAKVSWKPEHYHSLTPYLTVSGAAKAIDFYKKAFGAEELYKMEAGGRIMHAEIRVGDSVMMLADELPEMGAKSPTTLGGATGGLMLYVENCDAAFDRAVKAGATAEQPPTDMFWGDRYCKLKDPFGHSWSLGTHLRDVSPEEMKKAQDEWMKQQAQHKK